MTPMPLRVGMHDFINAQPILLPLVMDAERLGLQVTKAPPARLAELMHAGDLDLAMIPSYEYLREADAYRLVPGICIASRGPVGSVLLACRKPLDRIRTLALDNRSKTSVVLLSILFERRLGRQVAMVPCDPDPDRMLARHDAALVIGDQAFLLDREHPDLTLYDLSEEWFDRTGKPFVHAVFAVRPEVRMPPGLARFLADTPRYGLGMLEDIVHSTRVRQCGLTPEACRDYLTRKIIYKLGEAELDGLLEFREICYKGKLLEHQHPIEFT